MSERAALHQKQDAPWNGQMLCQVLHIDQAAVPQPFLSQPIHTLSIDTRTLEPDALFIALQGLNSDGHNFCSTAFQKGAAAALVSHRPKNATPTDIYLETPDTYKALYMLARHARARTPNTIFLGITGSSGKTTLKEGLSYVLNTGDAFCTPRSFNNHLGIPLSLARMAPGYRHAIFEMGMNHAGELTELGHLVQPHIGLIANIGLAHIGHFKNREDLACAKAELIDTIAPGGTMILNRDDNFFDLCAKKVRAHHLNLLTFGTHTQADVQLRAWTPTPQGAELCIQALGKSYTGTIPHTAKHWALNATAILAMAHLLGQSFERTLKKLHDWPAPSGRGRTYTLTRENKTLTLIDDSYNANPSSMKAALQTLGFAQRHTGGRCVAVLGDMGELGTHAEAEHASLADAITQNHVTCLITVGAQMKRLAERCAQQKTSVHSFVDVDDLLAPKNVQSVMCFLQNHDTVLVKGSRTMQLDRFVSFLREK